MAKTPAKRKKTSSPKRKPAATTKKKVASKKTANKKRPAKKTTTKKKIAPSTKKKPKAVNTKKQSSAKKSEAKAPKLAPPKESTSQQNTIAPFPSSISGGGEINAINLYYKNISQVSLLSPKEEVNLAARIKKGDERARDLMIRANLRLVVKIAHNYTNMGLSLLDLISEGNIGLMKAVERFDPKKGGKLSTYAAWWIKQSIKRALSNQSKTIRVPIYLVDKISKMRKVISELEEDLRREPTHEEIAAVMGTSTRKIVLLKAASKRTRSLNAPLQSEEGEKEYSELIGDESTPTPSENFEDKSLIKDIHTIFSQLKPRDEQVIRMRFGLDNETPMTLDEVGQRLDITRERVRQIQESALKQIRSIMEEMESMPNSETLQEIARRKAEMQVIQQFMEERSESLKSENSL
ncbi:MAG: hypothetical protein Tsb0018_03940 [Opitutales bacterium]